MLKVQLQFDLFHFFLFHFWKYKETIAIIAPGLTHKKKVELYVDDILTSQRSEEAVHVLTSSADLARNPRLLLCFS